MRSQNVNGWLQFFIGAKNGLETINYQISIISYPPKRVSKPIQRGYLCGEFRLLSIIEEKDKKLKK